MVWHSALHAVAAALLLAIGLPLLWAAWRARKAHPTDGGASLITTDATVPLVAIAAGLSYAAAAIHLAVVPEHFVASAAEGIAFGLLALFQLATGGLLLFGADRFRAAIIAVNLGAVLMWMITRTTGVPFVPALAAPEVIALRDLAATTFELGMVAILCGVPLVTARTQRFASLASASLVPVLGLVAIFTLLAVAGPAPLHEHGRADSFVAHPHGSRGAAEPLT